MAQLKDTVVYGNLRVTDSTLTDILQVTTVKAPTTAGGTTYGVGSNKQVLTSNGTSSYWGAANDHTHSQYYDSTISRTKNTVLAAPNGSNGAATFRALVAADIPALNYSKVTSSSNNGYIKVDNTDTLVYSHPSYTANPFYDGRPNTTANYAKYVNWDELGSITEYHHSMLKYYRWQGSGEWINLAYIHFTQPYCDQPIEMRIIQRAVGPYKIVLRLNSENDATADIAAFYVVIDSDSGNTISPEVCAVSTIDNTGGAHRRIDLYVKSFAGETDLIELSEFNIGDYSKNADKIYYYWNGSTYNTKPADAVDAVVKKYVTQADGVITTKLTVGTGYGSTQTSNALKIWTRASTYASLLAYWSYGATWGTYGAEIAYCNQYNGDTPGTKGALLLLPYQTTTNPYNGDVGLWVIKDHVYIDGTELSKTTHNHDGTYVPLTGSTDMSGLFQANGNSAGFAVVNTDNNRRISLHIGSGGENRGLYDWGGSSYPAGTADWVFRIDAQNRVGLRATLLESSTANNGMPIPVLGGTPGTETKNIYNSDGFRINLQSGTTSTTGKAELVLGNSSGSTTDGNKQGQLSIYSTSTSYHRIQAASTSTSKTWTLPTIPGITVNGSASHANVFAANRYSIIYDDTSHSSTPWYKFAEITITTTYEDHIITFLVSNGYCDSTQTVGEMTGILTAHVRTGSAKTHDSSNSNAAMELKWNLACSNVNPADYVMVYTDTANTSCKVELWCKMTKQYDSRIFQVLKEHKRREIGTYWTLIRNNGSGRSANYTSGTGTITSTLCTLKNPTA